MTQTQTVPKVAVGVVHGNEVPVSFMNSWTNLLLADLTHWGVLAQGPGLLAVRAGTDGLVQARNTVVQRFLESECDWLMWVDSDMGFGPDAVYKLLMAADPVERPIMGGLCFASREFGDDLMGGYRTKPTPTIFEPGEYLGLPRPVAGNMYPVNSVVRCMATGGAFILVHRSVFETIGGGWYERIADEAGPMGEDISFCMRAAAAGFPIHVHTGARTSHFKPRWLSEEDYWREMIPPPATAETAVIIPVTQRPQNAYPFMTTLRASTGLAQAYAVCDRGDEATIAAWEDAGACVLTAPVPLWGGVGSFAQKVNAAARVTDEPWLFLVGDDVRFRAGWLDHAQHVAATWNAAVVGTNDLGTQRVRDGEHATHLLIARKYVDELGASWAGPGVVCHEGYRHWYVDDEIVTAARQRGVWQMALGSIVEHLHPLLGKAADDPVYQLGQSYADEDRKEFEQRCATFL